MTNKELKKLIDEFVSAHPIDEYHEWYATEREFCADIMHDFTEFLTKKGKKFRVEKGMKNDPTK